MATATREVREVRALRTQLGRTGERLQHGYPRYLAAAVAALLEELETQLEGGVRAPEGAPR